MFKKNKMQNKQKLRLIIQKQKLIRANCKRQLIQNGLKNDK